VDKNGLPAKEGQLYVLLNFRDDKTVAMSYQDAATTILKLLKAVLLIGIGIVTTPRYYRDETVVARSSN